MKHMARKKHFEKSVFVKQTCEIATSTSQG